MGNPISPMVANICLEDIEELAISKSPTPTRIRKCYVKDVVSIIIKNAEMFFSRRPEFDRPTSLSQ